ncbi:histidinol dehydrogenase [Flavobacteriaceae bacterium UJ101]|nr:histidinol dehydrogenase [Flavobacteriaceae bacterium UJ101]
MNKTYNPSKEDWKELIKRPVQKSEDLNSLVRTIFDDIKEKGDQAIKEYTQRFDQISLEEIQVSKGEIEKDSQKVSEELKRAIEVAYTNIFKFHKSQELQVKKIEITEGVICWQESRPIESVGIYIPGGTAPLFSTVLMLGIPAKIAGCQNIILCTPPDENGAIDPAILYTAQLIGIETVFKVGGIQAIGAMTFGTETLPKVYKILGPGNQYVTAAKQVATHYGVAIDMPAGPSELLVIADETCIPAYVAADLLSQAEHGIDSQVIAVINNEETLLKIEKEVNKQLEELPRKEIAKEAIAKSKLIMIEDEKDTLSFVNEYAPEHLIVVTKNDDFYIQNIQNAGSVFIGNYTPESAGDYASGTNHTLPTNGFAKNYSGVNLDTFVKKITFQEITKKGIQKIGQSIEVMAENEGLQAHKNAVTLRLNKVESE